MRFSAAMLLLRFCRLILQLFLFPILADLSPASNRLVTPHTAHYPGDIYLGGLFPVSRRNVTSGACLPHRLSPLGLAQLEAMIFSVEQVNNDSILPGFTLGAIALDTCGSDRGGHLAALQLMLLDDLSAHGDDPMMDLKNKSFVGVVGPNYDSVASTVADLFSFFHLPQISYGATSSLLTNPHRFSNFLRTVPSDVHLINAIVQILVKHNWTTVAVVYEHTHYGTKWFQKFETRAKLSEICISRSFWIDPSKMNDTNAFDDVVKTAAVLNKTNVLLSQLQFEFNLRLLDAINADGLTDRFTFITTDWWPTSLISPKYHEVLEGTLAIVPALNSLNGFEDFYYKSLLSADYYRNGWAYEWRKEFEGKCRHANNYDCIPTPAEIRKEFPTAEFGSLHFVRDSVYSFAMALKEYHIQICGPDTIGICAYMQKSISNMMVFPSQFQRLLRKQECKGKDGAVQPCYVNGTDGRPNLSVMNFQKLNFPTDYKWTEVGKFSGNLARIVVHPDHFREKDIRYMWIVNGSLSYERLSEERGREKRKFSYPPSSCGLPCGPTEVAVISASDRCCFTCAPCVAFPYVKLSESNCSRCQHEKPFYQQPNANRSGCEMAPIIHFGLRDFWGFLVLVMASLGVMGTLIVSGLFFRYFHTPIMKASGRELSLMTLAGVLLGYLTTLSLLLPPSMFICVFIRFSYGLSYVLCYAAILTKANRIRRIFERQTGPQSTKVRYISPLSQVLIVLLLVSFQAVINIVWLILRPAEVDLQSHLSIEKGSIEVYSYCGAFSDQNVVVTLIFPAVLLLFCLFYAVKTRKVPSGFSESKPIFVSVYTTFLLWLVFVPVFFAIQPVPIRIFVLAIAKIINATVTLACIFGPKLFLAIFHPERNTKETLMGRRGFVQLRGEEKAKLKNIPTEETDDPADNQIDLGLIDKNRPSETPLLKLNGTEN